MKLQNPLLIFLLLASTFIISCKKEKIRDNPLTPSPITAPIPQPVARNLINAQLIPVGNLSQSRSDIAVASIGNKIFFAGGLVSQGVYSSRVDIYDITTNSWTTAELSEARSGIATAVSDKKIYFAGGRIGPWGSIMNYSGRVDIYNTATNSWTTTNLKNVEALMAGAAAGNKVVFASGVTAHIYDASTNIWSTAPLSGRPGEGNCCQGVVGGIAATVIGNTIYFAGGLGDWEVHRAIDIYNTSTNTWSTSSLSESKGYAAGIAVGNINYWAGGYTYPYDLSSQVEIRNMSSGAVTFGNLFQGNSHFSAVQKKDTIVFFTGAGAVKNKFDIYAINSNNWSIGLLPENIEGAAIISVNNIIYVAGGNIKGGNVNVSLSNHVRKLEF